MLLHQRLHLAATQRSSGSRGVSTVSTETPFESLYELELYWVRDVCEEASDLADRKFAHARTHSMHSAGHSLQELYCFI